jgi:hypothetical protein
MVYIERGDMVCICIWNRSVLMGLWERRKGGLGKRDGGSEERGGV